MFNREMKTRFNLLKPPPIKDTIIDSQQKSIQNYKGKRNVNFEHGQKVYIRDYTDPNKPGWQKAKITKKLGPRSYNCIITKTNRIIKRHSNQVRAPSTTETNIDSMEGEDGNNNPKNNESTDTQISQFESPVMPKPSNKPITSTPKALSPRMPNPSNKPITLTPRALRPRKKINYR